jgi:hypothetical protein
MEAQDGQPAERDEDEHRHDLRYNERLLGLGWRQRMDGRNFEEELND